MTLEDEADAEAAIAALEPIAAERPTMADGVLRMPIRQRKGAIGAAVIRLNEAGIGIDDVAMRRPSLDDVFLTLTGHSAEDGDEPEAER